MKDALAFAIVMFVLLLGLAIAVIINAAPGNPPQCVRYRFHPDVQCAEWTTP